MCSAGYYTIQPNCALIVYLNFRCIIKYKLSTFLLLIFFKFECVVTDIFIAKIGKINMIIDKLLKKYFKRLVIEKSIIIIETKIIY